MELINQYATVFVYLLLVLQVLDALTTLYVLRKGTGVEGNPFMRKLMEFFGPELGMLLPKIVFAGAIWTFRDTTPAWAFAALCVFYVAIVLNNMRFVLRAK